MQSFRGAKAVRRAAIALVGVSLLAVTACTSTSSANASDKSDGGKASPSKSSAPPLSLTVAQPADKASNVLTSTDIAVTTGGKVSTVSLVGSDGAPVPGALAADGKTWIPGKQLAYSASYTVKVTAASGDRTKTVTSTFTTMPKPSAVTGADLYVTDGETVGVGLPIVVEFTKPVPDAQRATIERRLYVTSTPKVEGSWHWFSNSEVHFRPRYYWPSGTKVAVRVAIGGLPMGNGRYGKRDRVVNFTVGPKIVSKVINATHTMTVYKNGAAIKTFPISLGKASTPTSSGVLVAMEKAEAKTFDSGTFGVPADSAGGYRQKVYWDVRFTWGGEFVHAAPWSVGDQGQRNVSHGCVNASTANARWFYGLTQRGDIIQIVGTERAVAPGDGWTDWTMNWSQYVAGSALR